MMIMLVIGFGLGNGGQRETDESDGKVAIHLARSLYLN